MNKYINLSKNVFSHELISGSFYIFLGTTISSALAFILNLFLVRNLSYIDYGVFAVMMSIILLLTIPSASFSAVIVRYATNFFTMGENARAGAFYFKLLKYLIIFCVLIVVGFIILSPLISDFLKIDDFNIILISGISVALFYLATLNTAYLQSLLLFKKLGFLTFISGATKLIVGAIMVYAGFKVFGGLIGNMMYPMVAFTGGLFFLRNVLKNRNASVNIPVGELGKFAFPTMIAIISLSSFISIDVILIKHYFSPTDAGLYGGLSLIGRVIYYFTAPIALVMFPLVVKRHTTGKNYNNLLYLSLLLVIFSGVLISLFYFLFPHFTISIFLGGREYYTLTPLVGLFGVFITIFSINNVFVNFFLSIKKTFVSVIVLFLAILQILLILKFHETFSQVLTVSISVSLLLTVMLVLYYLKINGTYNFKKS